jgi:CHASE2 domain-containing sensor protein
MLLAILAAAAVAGVLIELSRHQLMIFEAPDRIAYDWRHALLSRQEPTTRTDIALILITDKSLAGYSYQLPIDRGLVANVVRALDAAGAKVVGLDLLLDRPTDKDGQLIEAIRAAKTPVVLGAVDTRSPSLETQNLTFERGLFTRAGNPAVGHLYFQAPKRGLAQPDQVIRFLPQRSSRAGEIQPSFAEALVRAAGRLVPDIGEHISWLQSRAADGAETFEVFEVPSHPPEAATPDVVVRSEWRTRLKDKIVIIGGALEDRDRHLTPMSVADGARMHGPRIQAQIAAQLIDGRSLRGLSMIQELVLVFALALIGFVGGRVFRLSRYQPLVYVAAFLLLVLAGGWLFAARGLILPSDTVFYSILVGIWVGHISVRWLPRLKAKGREAN